MRRLSAVFTALMPIVACSLSFTLGCVSHEHNFLIDRPEFGVVPQAHDALDEVNAARKAKGLRPYLRDNGLTEAAKKCAVYRADHLCSGHTRNDFAFVPSGTEARVAGCAAWPESWGWGACSSYSREYTY